MIGLDEARHSYGLRMDPSLRRGDGYPLLPTGTPGE
jgi:hypothetical protein